MAIKIVNDHVRKKLTTCDHKLFLGKSESSSELDKRLSMIGVNQCALLCYTSGTTGNPKGRLMCTSLLYIWDLWKY